MPKILSTSDIPPGDQVAYWVDAVCDSFVHMDCEPERDRPFFGEISLDIAGALQIATATSTAQRTNRSPRQVARDSAESLFICFQRVGRGRMIQDGRESELKPGDFHLAESARPFRTIFDGDFSSTVLRVPRSAMLQRLGAPERFTAMTIDGSAGVGALISPLLRELPRHLDAIPAVARGRFADNLLDLIATAFLATNDSAQLTARMTLTRAKLCIETHLGEELSAELIAARCSCSVRHLNRLFEREGTSLMHHVWERRLARCHRDLLDPAMGHRLIGEIAFAAGFNDLSHFSRAYRARYGISPREARAAR